MQQVLIYMCLRTPLLLLLEACVVSEETSCCATSSSSQGDTTKSASQPLSSINIEIDCGVCLISCCDKGIEFGITNNITSVSEIETAVKKIGELGMVDLNDENVCAQIVLEVTKANEVNFSYLLSNDCGWIAQGFPLVATRRDDGMISVYASNGTKRIDVMSDDYRKFKSEKIQSLSDGWASLETLISLRKSLKGEL